MGLYIFGLPDPYEGRLMGYRLFFDTKFNFVEHPLLISGDLGFMAWGIQAPLDDWITTVGLHPIVLIGSNHLYGGLGWNYLEFRTKHDHAADHVDPVPLQETHTSRELFPRIMLGIAAGKKWRFSSEISYYFETQSYPSLVVGFGIHRNFTKKK